MTFYLLDGKQQHLPAPLTAPKDAPTLIVTPPHATASFDSPRIIYFREPHRPEYFANSAWADTPARMMAPLIVASLQQSAAFRAVVLSPSTAAGELRLDVDIIRLQQEFGSSPSHVRFTLRSYLVDTESRQIVAWREFDESVSAPQDTPYGGVLAANIAVGDVLEQLTIFCAEAAKRWHERAPYQ